MNARPDIDDRKQALEEFAAGSQQPHLPGAPGIAPMVSAGDRVFGAQKVAVYREDARVLQKLAALGAAAGDDWFYRYPVKNRKENRTDWIEGASIKLANDVARIYGNCDVDTRVFDIGDAWVIYARFTDYESGFSMTRPFQQWKGAGKIGGAGNDGDARRLDMAFQTGVSKAIRNVVVNALQTYADYAFDAARNSLVEKIGQNLDGWRTRVVEGLGKIPVDLVRAERVVGKPVKDWLAPDVAKIIAMMKAIADGMASADESFPPLDANGKPVDEAGTGDAGDGLNGFANKNGGQQQAAQEQPASTQQASSAASPPAASGQPASAQQQEPPTGSGAASGAGAAQAGADDGHGKTPAFDVSKTPTTEAEYIVYATAWREAIKAPEEGGAGLKRWKDEKTLRNKINISGDARDDLQEKLTAHVAALGAAKK
jgi:hypothetical protein